MKAAYQSAQPALRPVSALVLGALALSLTGCAWGPCGPTFSFPLSSRHSADPLGSIGHPLALTGTKTLEALRAEERDVCLRRFGLSPAPPIEYSVETIGPRRIERVPVEALNARAKARPAFYFDLTELNLDPQPTTGDLAPRASGG